MKLKNIIKEAIIACLFISCSADNDSTHEILSTPIVSELGISRPIVGYTYQYSDEEKKPLFYFEFSDNNQLKNIRHTTEYGSYSVQHNPLSFYRNNKLYEHDFTYNPSGCATSFFIDAFKYNMEYDENNHLIKITSDNQYFMDCLLEWDSQGKLLSIKRYNNENQIYSLKEYKYSSNKKNEDGVFLPEFGINDFVYNAPYLFFSGLLGRPSSYLPDSYNYIEYGLSNETGKYSYSETQGHVYHALESGTMVFWDGDSYKSEILFAYQYKGLHNLLPK